MDSMLVAKFLLIFCYGSLFYQHRPVQAQVDGTLRLVNGYSTNEGRLEVYYNNEWGTICDDVWGSTESTVACRQLGYSGYDEYYSNAYFGQGSGPIWMDQLDCDGSESQLQYCSRNPWGSHDCTHGEDISVRCSDGIASGTLRLVSGYSANEGRLEVYYNNEWGTICDDGWGSTELTVACRQLGYPGYDDYYSNAYFGQGSGPIWLDEVDCYGSESQLQYCSRNPWGNNDCSHSEDISLRCSDDGPNMPASNGDMRLIDGDSQGHGRVEIFYGGIWGTVCDDGWGRNEAKVVCKALGFDEVESDQVYDVLSGSGTIWLDEVECSGDESSLMYCNHNAWGSNDCSHSEDVAIRCRNSASTPGDLTVGAIVGIVIGSLAAACVLLFCCCSCNNQNNRQNSTAAATSGIGAHPPPSGNNNPVFTVSDTIGYSHNNQSLMPNPPGSDIPDELPPAYDTIDKYSSYIVPGPDGAYPPGVHSSAPPPPPPASIYPPSLHQAATPTGPPPTLPTYPPTYVYPSPASTGLPPVNTSHPYPSSVVVSPSSGSTTSPLPNINNMDTTPSSPSPVES